MNGTNQTAIVAKAERADVEILRSAREAVHRQGDLQWTVGECAREWLGKDASRTQQQFADLVGTTQSQVSEAVRVLETFGDYRTSDRPLTYYSHYRAALNWDDADHWLQYANDLGCSVREMIAARRVDRGEATEVTVASGNGEPTVPPDSAEGVRPDALPAPAQQGPAGDELFSLSSHNSQGGAGLSAPRSRPEPKTIDEQLQSAAERFAAVLQPWKRSTSDLARRREVARLLRAWADEVEGGLT